MKNEDDQFAEPEKPPSLHLCRCDYFSSPTNKTHQTKPNLKRINQSNITHVLFSIWQKHLFLFPITLEDNRVSPNIEVAQVLGSESQKKNSGRRDSLPSYRKE